MISLNSFHTGLKYALFKRQHGVFKSRIFIIIKTYVLYLKLCFEFSYNVRNKGFQSRGVVLPPPFFFPLVVPHSSMMTHSYKSPNVINSLRACSLRIWLAQWSHTSISPYKWMEDIQGRRWPAWTQEDNHTLMQCLGISALIWQMMKPLVWKVFLKILVMVLAVA